MRGRASALVPLAAALLFCCQACTATSAHVGESAHVGKLSARILVVDESNLHAMLADDPGLARAFAGRVTYVAEPAAEQRTVPRPDGTVSATAIYTSYAAFAQDVADGKVPSFVHAVLYDVEKWAATPIAEQRNPRAYMARFSKLARAHGLVPLLAPARDLALVPGGSCVKRPGENLTQAYVRCGLATADADAAVLVVQSQVDEFDLPVYRSFLAEVARQARAANPRVAVVAELATAPNGQVASLAQLAAAARSVYGLVQGFSLTARTADLQTAARLLQSLRQ
jgi:hypothetical protein